MDAIKRNKVVVIGSGNVGESVAYSLVIRGSVSEVAVVDIAWDRAEGCALDISHGLAYHGGMKVRAGDYDECADAGIIIISAGVGRKPGQSRLELAKTNVAIMKSICKSIMKYAKDPIIIVISNPVDVLTYVAQHETGLPPERVIGTGTLLDTARMRYQIAERCGCNILDVNAFVLGEHGDSEVPVWSGVSIGGVHIRDYEEQTGIDVLAEREDIDKTVREAGGVVIKLKGATHLGVALNTAHLVEAIIGDSDRMLPLSQGIDNDRFGSGNISFSLPCIVNRNGIKKVVVPELTEEEMEGMRRSAAVLRKAIDGAYTED